MTADVVVTLDAVTPVMTGLVGVPVVGVVKFKGRCAENHAATCCATKS